MGLRLPIERHERSPHDRAVCEDVLDGLVRRCGLLIDRTGLEDACAGDASLVRYARDVLGLFSSLGQVEHVRRDLWIVSDCGTLEPTGREFLRAAAASRALGSWTVIAGAWALVLRGVLDPARGVPGVRFGLTPKPSKLATRSAHGQARRRDLPASIMQPETAQRHVTIVDGIPIAAVTRPSARLGDGEYLEHQGFGAHVLHAASAFISMLEHPRLSGGIDAARRVSLPVLGHVGIGGVLDAGSRHRSIAVRRRLAFVLIDALQRVAGAMSWFGPDELGITDDIAQSWRIERALDVRPGTRPTLLDPHRLPIGRLLAGAVIDNRGAPIRFRQAERSVRAQLEAARAVAAERERQVAEAEQHAMERRSAARVARWTSAENRR